MESNPKIGNMVRRLIRIFACLILICIPVSTWGQECGDSIPDTDSGGGIDPQGLVFPIDPVLPPQPVEPVLPGPYYPELAEYDKVPTVDPLKPDIPTVNNKMTVGSSASSLSVSSNGSASYAFTLNCPDGGALTPSVSLLYDSQGNESGIAGYGFGLSGFSSITRGGKTRFNNDGKIAGVTYTASDYLYLDGKRLILLSGEACQEGAEYVLEGDPYTHVTVHGSYSDDMANCWFEVHTSAGMTLYFGSSEKSRVEFTDSKGIRRIASWHLDRSEDPHGNYAEYSYIIDKYFPYPSSIKYGGNVHKDRGLAGQIKFEYANIGATPAVFNLGGVTGKMDRRIASIVTSLNGQIYRKYTLTYDTTSDHNLCKFARLVEFQEENGNGDKMTPTRMAWDNLYPSSHTALIGTSISDPTIADNDNPDLKTHSSIRMAADLNADGVSDIIRIADVEVYEAGFLYPDKKNWVKKTHVYISLSEVGMSGSITYKDPVIWELPPSVAMSENATDGEGSLSFALGGASLMDFDGDGYNDLIIPMHSVGEKFNDEFFYFISGKDTADNNTESFYKFGGSLKSPKETPIFVTFDTDGDGRDDLVCVEPYKYNGKYPVQIFKWKGGEDFDQQLLDLDIPDTPKNIFSGDYNADGLADIIFLYKDGYKIFFNSGGSADDIKFSDSNSFTGTGFGDQWRCCQGDIDGDGLIDFIYNTSGKSVLGIAHNNGDGTFSFTESDDIGVFNGSNDNSRFAIHVYDMDCDGRSDAFVCKAQYSGKDFKKTVVARLLSDGSTLRLIDSIEKDRAADADESSIFLGDFDGNGVMEIANCGSNLDVVPSDVIEGKVNIYRNASITASSGKITSVTDGMGNQSKIQYLSATNPKVYTRDEAVPAGLDKTLSYTLPLSVVSKVTLPGGVAKSRDVEYRYKNLLVHTEGAGALGFAETSVTDRSTGQTVTEKTTKWDSKRMIPLESVSTTEIDDKSSSVTSSLTVTDIKGTYATLYTSEVIVDLDGNRAVKSSEYDIETGIATDVLIMNDDTYMYREVHYRDLFQTKSGVWVPEKMTAIQKHRDDTMCHSTTTAYTYNDFGDIITRIDNYGSDKPLKTTNTYNVFGNIQTTSSSGIGVTAIRHLYGYDPTGRFLIKSFQNPAANTIQYTYDLWGNLLTEEQITTSGNNLVTSHTYDGWGNLVATEYPDGSKSEKKIGWGSEVDKKYYTFETFSERPWVLTWHDSMGHETRLETFGPQNVLISKSTGYDNAGRVVSTTSTNGRFGSKRLLSYDGQGRLSVDSLSTGKCVRYTYGNRTVTQTESGKTVTSVSDAWGNPIRVTDANGGAVRYTYGSVGKPTRISSCGSAVTMRYDNACNLISQTDPDAGTSSFEYAADGKLLSSTDARGIKTTRVFDSLGRVQYVKTDDERVINTYGTSGPAYLRLTRQKRGDNSISYEYDKYGRVTSETRTVGGDKTFTTRYNYDSRNRLSSKVYPDSLEVNYEYDDYGFMTDMTVNGKSLCRQYIYEGNYSATLFADSILYERTIDKHGFETTRGISRRKRKSAGIIINSIKSGYDVLDRISTAFDPVTGNLISRNRLDSPKEEFSYDILDRLTGISAGDDKDTDMTYAPNGNILSKTGLGGYTYLDDYKPHAVMSVENREGMIPSSTLETMFDSFGMVRTIADEECGLRMELSNGPDLQRWYSVLTRDSLEIGSTLYAGDYERVEMDGKVRHFHYLDGNVIVIGEDGVFTPYLALTDHLGSVLAVFDEKGEKVFDASYDAWGLQTVCLNTIGLRRGYTGHEMLNEFGIINMNGRLYDPVLGRFFSPDPYVQSPDFTQSFNRYSYCFNNPLKYTDPTGEIAFETVAFGLFNMASSMLRAAATGGNIWRAGISSLLRSAASFGIGELFKKVGFFKNLPSTGRELLRAGAHGISGGLAGMIEGSGLLSGFLSGVASSGIDSYSKLVNMDEDLMHISSTLLGGLAAYAVGGDFLQGALNGLNIAFFNHSLHPDEESPFTVNDDGEFETNLPELVVTAPRIAPIYKAGIAMTVANYINSFIEGLGSGAREHGGNVTIGSNGKIYNLDNKKRVFYGNQYVKTTRIQPLGDNIATITRRMGWALAGIDLALAALSDYNNYQIYGYTDGYNSVHSISNTAVTMAGAAMGAEIGADIGLFFGGVGAIPGSLIGSAVGAVAGTYFFRNGGTTIANYIYNH